MIKNKKVYLIVLLSTIQINFLHAHLERNKAENITIGILSNARLDPSSVTLLGPTIEGGELSGNVIAASNTINGDLLYNRNGVIRTTHTASGDFVYNSAGVIVATMTSGGWFLNAGISGTSGTITGNFETITGSITTRGIGNGLHVGTTNFIITSRGAGIGTDTPISGLDIVNSSITVRGTNAGIRTTGEIIAGTTLTVRGAVQNINGVAWTWPSTDGTNGQLLSTNGSGTFSFATDAGGTRQLEYDVIVGTLNSISTRVNISSNNTDGLKEALRRLNANGISSSATGYGTIFYDNGNYDIGLATIPIGVKIFFASSATWRATDSIAEMCRVYGTLVNPNFEMSLNAATWTGARITLKDNGKIINANTMGCEFMSTADNFTMPYLLENSSNNILIANFDKFTAAGQDQAASAGLFMARGSTDSYIYVKSDNGTFGTVGRQSIIIAGGKNLVVDGYHKKAGARFVNVWHGGGDHSVLIKGYYEFTSGRGAGAGHFFLNPGQGALSTGTIISINVLSTVADVDPIINVSDATVNGVVGTLIKDCHIVDTTATTLTFVETKSGSINTEIRDCAVFGVNPVLLTSAGGGDRSLSLGNTLNAIPQ